MGKATEEIAFDDDGNCSVELWNGFSKDLVMMIYCFNFICRKRMWRRKRKYQKLRREVIVHSIKMSWVDPLGDFCILWVGAFDLSVFLFSYQILGTSGGRSLSWQADRWAETGRERIFQHFIETLPMWILRQRLQTGVSWQFLLIFNSSDPVHNRLQTQGDVNSNAITGNFITVALSNSQQSQRETWQTWIWL